MTTRMGSLMDAEVFKMVRPKFSRIYVLFPQGDQPVILDDMMPDMNRLMHSVARRYTDETSAHLCYEEMLGESRLKLAELIDRGELVRQPTRGHFFRFFKTALQNQARSRVQKYRFTEKRTGIKPPPREQRDYAGRREDEEHLGHDHVVLTPEHHKNVELSLDDPELNLQVSDPLAVGSETSEIMEDWNLLLSAAEQLVFRQMTEPNELAHVYAQLDGYYRKTAEKVVIRVKQNHLALGLGMTPELFEEAVLSIRQKIQSYRNMTDADRIQESRYNVTLASLKQLFGLQIPPNTEEMTVRRLLTIAARDQFSKINQQVAEMLEICGAKVPRLHQNEQLSCYGVLFQKNNRYCNHCGLRESCSVEANNVGLGNITLSPRLLGARQTRVPAILPVESDTPMQVVGTSDEAEIISYLDETFVQSKRRNEVYYALKDSTKRSFLFCIEERADAPFRLRFCNPSEALKHRLRGQKRSWYAPSTATVQDVIALIDQHAKESLEADDTKQPA